MNKILLAFMSCIIFCGCENVVKDEDIRAYCLTHDQQFQDVLNKYGAKCDIVYNVGLNADETKVIYKFYILIDKKQH